MPLTWEVSPTWAVAPFDRVKVAIREVTAVPEGTVKDTVWLVESIVPTTSEGRAGLLASNL